MSKFLPAKSDTSPMVLQLVFAIYKTTIPRNNQLIKSCQYQRLYLIMKSFIFLIPLFTISLGGHITHSDKATSYQNIEIQHHHAVPTYIKKEDAQFLAHPIPKGKTSAKVEIHHGGKHDHGYALTDVHNTNGHGTEDFGGEHGQVQYEAQEQSQQHFQYEPEVPTDQHGYQTIDVSQYAQLAQAAAEAFNQKYSQGVGQYEPHQQLRG